VRHWTRVLGELHLAQHAHVVNPFGGTGRVAGRAWFESGSHVGGEFLVAEHGQAFFQAQLEPVAAGHAVARPVVEVLMADHRFNVAEIHVRSRFGIREHVLCIEDVQALVFHRAHVEVAHGDDHETIQVELQPKAAFVPFDGMNQRIHGVLGLVEIVRFDPDLQQFFLPRTGLHALLELDELARHQCEQIAWFLERVFPSRKVPAIFQITFFDQVAV